MKSFQLKFSLLCISFLVVQLCNNSPPVADAWVRTAWRVVRRAMTPTCLGCAGICEYKVPGRCQCRVDQECMRRRGRGKRDVDEEEMVEQNLEQLEGEDDRYFN